MVVDAPRSPLRIRCSTRSQDIATLGEMERSRDEVVGVVGEVGEVVDEAVLGLKQRCVFGCSLGRELWRCTVPILDSMLVALIEPSASPVFFSVILHHERVI